MKILKLIHCDIEIQETNIAVHTLCIYDKMCSHLISVFSGIEFGKFPLHCGGFSIEFQTDEQVECVYCVTMHVEDFNMQFFHRLFDLFPNPWFEEKFRVQENFWLIERFGLTWK